MTDETRPTLDPANWKERDKVRRGPLGDARPNPNDGDPRTGGGQYPEDVEDRPVVSTVKPEDYPEDDRKDSSPDPKIG